MPLPQVGQLIFGQQRDVCSGIGLAEPEQCRAGHDGVAEPINAADDDAAGL
jgi:hypothetical protein